MIYKCMVMSTRYERPFKYLAPALILENQAPSTRKLMPVLWFLLFRLYKILLQFELIFIDRSVEVISTDLVIKLIIKSKWEFGYGHREAAIMRFFIRNVYE